MQRILDLFGKLSKTLNGLSVSTGPEDNTHNGPTDPSDSANLQAGFGSNETKQEQLLGDEVPTNLNNLQHQFNNKNLLQMLKNGRQ